jgi:alkanesulfonate monooxygenase SsuD/methylene tetrahydromethanopterin reductase-like flavin-dependent oxidoreductase (luciferase family)
VELGLGAGNWQHEFQQLGLPFDEAGVRVSRFAEAVSVIKQYFTGDTVNFSGKYYTVAGLRPTPKPVQQPRPPIVIGSGGRRMLTIAAREADVVLPAAAPGAGLETQIGWIREAAGERFERLELGKAAFGIELTDGSVAVGAANQGMPVESLPMTTEQAIARLVEQRDHLGVSYIQIQERQFENFAPVVARLNGK